jgi:hypothetical protein
MGTKRRPKTGSRTVTNAKKKSKKVKPDPRSGALRRAAKAGEKARAREKKARATVRKRSNELDAALTALKKTDVGSPKAGKLEGAARTALKGLLAQRKKLGKARKALRRAEAKERKARGEKKARAARKRSPKKGAVRGKSSATKPSALDTRRVAEAVAGMDAGAFPDTAAASPVAAKPASAPSM